MYDHSSEIKLSFDTGSLGDNVSSAHGHSDIFHFTLQQGEKQLIIDPGTYQYHQKESFWRNYFRSITAHNTISINNRNHAIMNNRMSWIDRPKKPKTQFLYNETETTCEGIHNAFSKENVIHKRTISFDKKIKKVLIKDTLTSNSDATKDVFYYLHFKPSIEVSLKGNEIYISRKNKNILIKNETFANKAVFFEGNEEIPIGWFSRSYNEKEKCKSLVLKLLSLIHI